MARRFPSISQLKTVAAFRQRLQELGLALPVEDGVLTAREGSPLAQPGRFGPLHVGNRWCIHPMEGWDGQWGGGPSPLTLRRWRHFGTSGAKLIWGGEAVAVVPEGRANPRQLLAAEKNRRGFQLLLEELKQAHLRRCGSLEGLVVGLQLTHSGRFSCPHGKPQPRIAWHHPLLDPQVGVGPEDTAAVLSDRELEALVPRYVEAAQLAAEVGFDFVDVKACHGYLLHELLGAHLRPGPFGGSLEGRSRLLRMIIQAIRRECPGLVIGVRLSAFDLVPFGPGPDGGRPRLREELLPYRWGFGVDPQQPTRPLLHETFQLLRHLRDWGVAAVNLSGGSPYYCPHAQRPAQFPPSDGYPPPEDPLVGVGRLLEVTRQCKEELPELPVVSTGYTYLQDYLPHVAQGVVRQGWADYVGLGRMVLSYPELPWDVLNTGRLDRRRICRTFSDCTTGPRNGLPSGCYPLDRFYKLLPEAAQLRQVKNALRAK